MTTIAISSTGRITIPAAIRRQLGWEPGTRLHVLVKGDEIILRRVRTLAELGGIFAEYAIPGTTHEQEREAMYEYIAQHYREVLEETKG